jgi:chemotaxis protein histidine kinase CheA
MLAHMENVLSHHPQRSFNKPSLEQVLGTVHLIKESTLVFNIEPASRMVSHMEETLNLVRTEILPLDQELLSTLMLCCDYLDELFSQYVLQNGYFLTEYWQAMEESLIYRLWNCLNRKNQVVMTMAKFQTGSTVAFKR